MGATPVVMLHDAVRPLVPAAGSSARAAMAHVTSEVIIIVNSGRRLSDSVTQSWRLHWQLPVAVAVMSAAIS